MLKDIIFFKKAKTKRISSYDVSGRNQDFWIFRPHESKIIADIKGCGLITHIWLTQQNHYREVLIKISWDDSNFPSIFCPLGDFFCLGHGIVNSFQSYFFTASTDSNNQFNKGCALNCYLPMPFKKRAVIELINESNEIHKQYFHIDYELYDSIEEFERIYHNTKFGYLHAEFHRENPFGGWGHEIKVNAPEVDIVNKEKLAWENNLVILEAKGRGHYIGCNYSITNLQGSWWGEGDDMIWIDGYKWPPDLHGTGSEDYLNQAWGMQNNSFLRNGSSIHEKNTGGYQTSYIFHIENPIRFEKEIKVTIEFGHGNHLRNECSTVAYWYVDKPYPVKSPPPIEKRLPILKKNGKWILDSSNQITSKEIELNEEMKFMKQRWIQRNFENYLYIFGELKLNKIIEKKELLIRTKLTPTNLNLYSISISEILEDYFNSKVKVEIYDKTAISKEGFLPFPDLTKLIEIRNPKYSNFGILKLINERTFLEKQIENKNILIDLENKIIEFIPAELLNSKEQIPIEIEVLKLIQNLNELDSTYLIQFRIAINE